jgi:ATP-dependent exoDNAse (exonuclease V) beta subunit
MNTQSNLQIYNASAGSGKTFTLVAEYLKILFKSDDLFSFQQILAITFTNKAAAEMKVRILESLQEFSKPTILNKDNALFTKISKELNIAPNIIQKKSEKIIKNILNNYGAFNITTIDSFTYKLIRSFAFDLGIALNFEVEMDAISLLNEAVDVLISQIGEDKELTKTLIDFSISKANEDKSWDISIDLKEIAKLLLNENDILQVNKIKQKSIADFTNLQKNIQKQLKETEKQFEIIGNNGLELINDLQIEHKDFYYSQFPKHFSNLINDLSKVSFDIDKGLGKSIVNETFYTKGKPQEVKDSIESILPSLLDLYYESKKLNAHYLLNKLISKSLIPLSILRIINNVLTEIKEENNIRLISEFNQLISKHLKEQPAAFIYEKIGERFRYYFIDEMQDTSQMQWENLIPLLDNVLSSQNEKGITGSLLLVGDAKQAIYRWRGGKAEQFIELSSEQGQNPFLVTKEINQLDTNWRSYSEIINFNNDFFQHIAKYLKNDAYRELYKIGNTQKQNHKKGGYVEIQFVEEGLKAEEKYEIYPEKVLEIIQNITPEFDQKDICVLTRTRKQGVAIAEYLTGKGIAIISSETLLLQNSSKVSFIIDLLHFINQPQDEEVQFEILYFLYHHLELTQEKHDFFQKMIALKSNDLFNEFQKQDIYFDLDYFISLSLYESIEYIIRNFKLTTTSDAYLQFFLDVVLNFSLKKSEGIDGFLNYWDEKKGSLSIVVSSEKNAVNIMTIHKSKGLEFPVIIYPFDLDIYKQINPKVWYEPLDKETYNGFDSALINYNKSLKEIGKTGEYLFHSQREELELDNFNLLYVALTRAEEQLYIISEHRKNSDEPKYYSQFFIDYLNNKGVWNTTQDVFSFGNSQRLSKKKVSNQGNVEQETFISSDWRQLNINIVPATQKTEDKTEDAREYGNLIHEILAQINTKSDIENVIYTFTLKGLIATENKENITEIVHSVVLHSELKDFFTDEFKILNEREIITNQGDVIIPDRLVFNNNEVVIIDYKTGKPEKSHHKQVINYAHVLKQMGYKVIKKLLVYIDEKVQVVIV